MVVCLFLSAYNVGIAIQFGWWSGVVINGFAYTLLAFSLWRRVKG